MSKLRRFYLVLPAKKLDLSFDFHNYKVQRFKSPLRSKVRPADSKELKLISYF